MSKNENKIEHTYGGSDIQVMEGLEAVRKRPGMYIGPTNAKGLHHMIWEIVDNSIDEALAGHCENITIEINSDNSISVLDDGRGIPVDIQPQTGRPAAEVVLTVLHAGGKFDGGGYKVSGGLHGVGVSVVNALSEKLELTVYRDGKEHQQTYSRGIPITDLEIVGEADKTGTKVRFWADSEIFDTLEYDRDTIVTRFREMSFLNPGLKIHLVDNRPAEKWQETFASEGGLIDFVDYLAGVNKERVHPDVIGFQAKREKIEIRVALQWTSAYQEQILAFANNIHTRDGGVHLSGFRTALTRTLNQYAKTEKIFKPTDPALTGEDLREGLTAIVAIWIEDPQFSSQTKDKLVNSAVEGTVNSALSEAFSRFWEENPDTVKAILNKAHAAATAREAARKAREDTRKKTNFERGSMPGKLADCSSKDATISELWIVEGDSAGGSTKNGRNRHTQAVLPLRGKIINPERTRLDRVMASEEVQAIIKSIGTGIREEFDVEKCRYNTIVIATDADADGGHIRTLILTLLYRNMPGLFDKGYVYAARPPLYRVQLSKKNVVYIENENQLEELLFENKYEEFLVNGKPLTKELWKTIKRADSRSSGARAALMEKYRELVLETFESLGLLEIPLNKIKEKLSKEFVFHQWTWKPTETQNNVIKGQIIDKDTNHCRKVEFNNHFLESDQLLQWHTEEQKIRQLFGEGPWQLEHGKETKTAATISSMMNTLKEMAKSKIKLQRFKGLGEMNAEQLFETTMDPEQRTLSRIKIEDAADASRTCALLMGEEVEPRKDFITEHAKDVQEVDA